MKLTNWYINIACNPGVDSRRCILTLCIIDPLWLSSSILNFS